MDGRVNGSISSIINGIINGIKTAVKRLKRNRFTAVLFPPFSEIAGRGSIQPACKKSFLLIFPDKINRFTISQ